MAVAVLRDSRVCARSTTWFQIWHFIAVLGIAESVPDLQSFGGTYDLWLLLPSDSVKKSGA